MIRVKQAGQTVYVTKPFEPPPGAGVISFPEDQWNWMQKIAREHHQDPEMEQTFWRTVLAKKKENPKYSIYQDFPNKEHRPGNKVCAEIIESLQGKKHEKK